MNTTEADSARRRVTANMSLTLDGRYNGPGGANDLGAIVPYAITDVARSHLARIWETATTAVLGRRNAEGFLSYWPSVASNQAADPRDRAYARWLVEVEKIVFSTTLTNSPWERTRLVNGDPVDIVTQLKSTGEGGILVNSSASIIKALLSTDLIDRLYLMICPQICGSGLRLFDDGLPGTKWRLVRSEVGELGEIAAIYDRERSSAATDHTQAPR